MNFFQNQILFIKLLFYISRRRQKLFDWICDLFKRLNSIWMEMLSVKIHFKSQKRQNLKEIQKHLDLCRVVRFNSQRSIYHFSSFFSQCSDTQLKGDGERRLKLVE